ncbi:MAG: hypothetical protein AAFX06_20375 [Planctomycetota bacterium]
MWPTTRGARVLQGAEARLMLGTLGMMVDRLVAEARSETERIAWGIDWFDQWDVGQRLWLLEQVTNALFGKRVLDPAAIFDATVDTLFLELRELVDLEIDDPHLVEGRSWRADLLAALGQLSVPHDMEEQSVELADWSRWIATLADEILGARNYTRAETFRDQDFSKTQAFLVDRGLPEDYLSRMPPLRSVDETQLSIDRIQAYVFR